MEWHFVQVMGSAREWYIQRREESVCPSFLPFEQNGQPKSALALASDIQLHLHVDMFGDAACNL